MGVRKNIFALPFKTSQKMKKAYLITIISKKLNKEESKFLDEYLQWIFEDCKLDEYLFFQHLIPNTSFSLN